MCLVFPLLQGVALIAHHVFRWFLFWVDPKQRSFPLSPEALDTIPFVCIPLFQSLAPAASRSPFNTPFYRNLDLPFRVASLSRDSLPVRLMVPSVRGEVFCKQAPRELPPPPANSPGPSNEPRLVTVRVHFPKILLPIFSCWTPFYLCGFSLFEPKFISLVQRVPLRDRELSLPPLIHDF